METWGVFALGMIAGFSAWTMVFVIKIFYLLRDREE